MIRSALLAVVLSIATAMAQQPFPPTTFRISVYFAATSVDAAGLESEYSNEVCLPITNRVTLATLAWDYPAGASNLTYKVYRGPKSRTYTTNFNAGNTNQITIPIFSPPLTNHVVLVTTTNATNILATDLISGPWVLINRTNWSGTNSRSPQFWRAVGRNGSSPGISITNWNF